MPLTLDQYATYLDSRALPWPAAPEVAAPRAKPHLVRIPELRAVLWNVYGTLLCINQGELLLEHPTAFIMDTALDKTIQEFKMWDSMSRKPGQPSAYLKSIYKEVVQDQALRSKGEVSVDKVWEAILKKLLQKDYKFDTGFFGALNEFSAKIAYFFHASLQATTCYAGAAQALRTVSEAGLEQGLLADGQCFTMLQLRRGLAEQDADINLDGLVSRDLRVFSHEVGAKKPSDLLFDRVLEKLAERDIEPGQVLHVGSRIAEDIVPAKKRGMRTALFAGDSASVRATAEQLKSAAGRPDLLLTSPAQIAEVIPES
jgi:FMN phosphatase YigB (HAD superfamily)